MIPEIALPYLSTNTLAAVEAMETEGGNEGRDAGRDPITG